MKNKKLIFYFKFLKKPINFTFRKVLYSLTRRLLMTLHKNIEKKIFLIWLILLNDYCQRISQLKINVKYIQIRIYIHIHQ